MVVASQRDAKRNTPAEGVEMSADTDRTICGTPFRKDTMTLPLTISRSRILDHTVYL